MASTSCEFLFYSDTFIRKSYFSIGRSKCVLPTEQVHNSSVTPSGDLNANTTWWITSYRHWCNWKESVATWNCSRKFGDPGRTLLQLKVHRILLRSCDAKPTAKCHSVQRIGWCFDLQPFTPPSPGRSIILSMVIAKYHCADNDVMVTISYLGCQEAISLS